MTTTELGRFLVSLTLLLALATVLGRVFARWHQPKVVGELLAGVLLGPAVLGPLLSKIDLGLIAPGSGPSEAQGISLGLVYELGLLFLMFVSGGAVRHVLGSENRRPTAWILAIGTPLPFFATLLVVPHLPLETLMGSAGSEPALVLLICSSVAVTSIPVITKIFSDLGILHTRFASLLLGSAVLEDIALWGVLSISTAIVSTSATTDAVASTVMAHVLANLAFVAVSFTLMPRLLSWLAAARWNTIAREAPIAWLMLVFLTFSSVAAMTGVTLAFAAFLAGIAVMGGVGGSAREQLDEPMAAVTAVAHAFFVPLYFAIVGLQLDLGAGFSPGLLVVFLLGSSALSISCGALAARLAGFRGIGVVNLAITGNARGGPGILLASVGYSAGIISRSFFTALVLTAVLTSQLCGAWLAHVLRRGWSLLGESPEAEAAWAAASGTATVIASPSPPPTHSTRWPRPSPQNTGSTP